MALWNNRCNVFSLPCFVFSDHFLNSIRKLPSPYSSSLQVRPQHPLARKPMGSFRRKYQDCGPMPGFSRKELNFFQASLLFLYTLWERSSLSSEGYGASVRGHILTSHYNLGKFDRYLARIFHHISQNRVTFRLATRKVVHSCQKGFMSLLSSAEDTSCPTLLLGLFLMSTLFSHWLNVQISYPVECIHKSQQCPQHGCVM